MDHPQPLASVVVQRRGLPDQVVPIYGRLMVGRECSHVDELHRLLIDDDSVSRSHLEIRLDPDQNMAFVTDMSTNGTRRNGVRIERAVAVELRNGDSLTVGGAEMHFQSDVFGVAHTRDARQTTRIGGLRRLVMVVGDIVTYSTISQYTSSDALIESLEVLWGELRSMLPAYRGTLNNYMGDAFFAIWEADSDPHSVENATRYALDASQRVREIAPTLKLRTVDDQPISMGWGVVLGEAAMSSLAGALVTVLGDHTNLAFRLSGLAGREGMAPVLVNEAAWEVVAQLFPFGPPHKVQVKGRVGSEVVYGLEPSVR